MSFRFAALLVATAGLMVSGPACGPIPQNTLITDGYRGYRAVPPRADAVAAASADEPAAHQAPRNPDPVPEPAQAEPAAEVAALPAGPTGPQELVVIDLPGDDRYYLVDPNRASCYLHEAGAVQALDCAEVPEAAAYLGSQSAPAPDAPAARPAPPTEAPRRAVSRAAETPTTESPPSRDEKRRFAAAYIESWCAVAGGRTTPRADILARQNLTTDRYHEVEAWMGADPAAMRRLDDVAPDTCGGQNS